MDHLADEPIDFTVTRIPYFLRPELPGVDQSILEGGKWSLKDSPFTWGDQIDGYTRKNPQKFGGEGQAPDARFGISWQAAEVGLRLVFTSPMSNSMDALRLLMKVQDEQSPAVREKFFEAVSRKYFTEGQALADHDTLLEAAQEAGVPTVGLREWLATDEHKFNIQRKYAEIFYGWGYTSVPVTLVSCGGVDQCVQGSQNLDAYLEVFRRLLDEPLPGKSPDEKKLVWEKLSDIARRTGSLNDDDFKSEAHDIFFGETAKGLRQESAKQPKALGG